MHAILTRVESVTPGVRTFWFATEKPLDYLAGQFIELYVPHVHPDERGEWRQFTLSSAPSEPDMAITVQFTSEDRSSSYKRALQALEPGATLQFTEPMGDFVLPKDATIPLVFVAGGIGITPVRSIVRWLADRNEGRPITLLYMARHAEHAPFDAFLRTQPLTYKPVFTESADRLTAASILQSVSRSADSRFYLSGPEAMVDILVQGFTEAGVDPFNIISDPFPAYPSL